jgi:ribonuclease VapC
MIVDTSVVVALAADEPTAGWIRAALADAGNEPLRMSVVNIAEAGMVLDRFAKGASALLEPALAAAGIAPLSVDVEVARIAVAARSRFPLNFGDCLAYAHARATGEALITLDDDFLRTDLERIVHPAPARRRRGRAR